MLRRPTTPSLWNCTITPPTRRLICRAGSFKLCPTPSRTVRSLRRPTYLVLAANGAAFAEAYGATNPVFDIFSGTLPANGILALNTSSNVTVAEVEYENQLPWPTNANGTGASLQLIDPHQDNWRAGNWAVGTYQPPTVTSAVDCNSPPPARPPLPCFTFISNLPATFTLTTSRWWPAACRDAGTNTVTDGDFESGFPRCRVDGVWPILTNSVLSTTVKHSGNASLHLDFHQPPAPHKSSAIYADHFARLDDQCDLHS